MELTSNYKTTLFRTSPTPVTIQPFRPPTFTAYLPTVQTNLRLSINNVKTVSTVVRQLRVGWCSTLGAASDRLILLMGHRTTAVARRRFPPGSIPQSFEPPPASTAAGPAPWRRKPSQFVKVEPSLLRYCGTSLTPHQKPLPSIPLGPLTGPTEGDQSLLHPTTLDSVISR